MRLSPEEFRFGIEHEFAVVDRDGRFCDFSTTTFEELDRVVERLPTIESDYPGLRVGDLGIKSKRWYIEGFERFTAEGVYLRTDPKGFEIRTPICESLDEAMAVLLGDIRRWEEEAAPFGYRDARTSLNPFRTAYVPEPPLNAWERSNRRTPEELTAHIHMLTYGPDISVSSPALTIARTIDIGRKLTHYSPWIVPFSFSSPFFEGRLWGGRSRRTYYRTGARPSALVFVGHDEERLVSTPTLTDLARLPAEVGRIEFKAFDRPPDVALFCAFGALLLGLALDETLPGRRTTPDGAAHRHVATVAFEDAGVREGAATVLAAARAALPAAWGARLDPLEAMLAERVTPADLLVRRYHETGDIIETITV